MNTVAIYTRNSANEADNGMQLAVCQKYCQANGLNVVTEISDHGSGNDDLPGLHTLRALAAEAKIDSVVVLKEDRLSRDKGKLHLLKAEFESAGVKVITVN